MGVWLSSLFGWREVKRTEVWTYYQNRVTGRRKAVWSGFGYHSLDPEWQRKGDIVVREGRHSVCDGKR